MAYSGRSIPPDAVEDRMWYNLVSCGKRSVNREHGSGTTENGNEMETGTSCFTKFDVQRNMLAEYLVSLCTVRSVDTTLAQQVINALDRLDPLVFDKIQVATLERFPEANRNNSYLDFCKPISKAVRLYLVFMEKNKKNRKYADCPTLAVTREAQNGVK